MNKKSTHLLITRLKGCPKENGGMILILFNLLIGTSLANSLKAFIDQ